MYTTLIEPDELAPLLATRQLRIFDVRHDLSHEGAGWAAYQQSRIPGAIFLDVEHELSGRRTSTNGRHPLPEREAFHELIVRCGVGNDTQVVVYDAQGGSMASRLWWMIRWLGLPSVAVLNGGWQAWRQAGLPVDESPIEERVLSGPTPEPLTLREPLVLSVTAGDVLRNLHAQDFRLIDARAQARFRGEIEPLDPVAGHIPGALNRPHAMNLGDDGRFKQASALRDEFAKLLGDTAPNQIVHQCGSGISACHNLLAMEHAGLAGSRLYPGSWSEWCSDPVRPVG